MSLQERVYSVLVVSSSGTFNTAILDMLSPSQFPSVNMAKSISEAKRCVAERSYDFIIVNSPLPDESGTRFAIDSCKGQATVVLILVSNDIYDEIQDRVAGYGVFTLPKPTARASMLCRERLRKMEQKNLSIEDRMKEIRLINRAKCLLISELRMSEQEAHRYIEKKAMDECVTRKEVAEIILQTYG